MKAHAHLTTPFFTMDLTSVQLVPVECWTLPITYPTQSSTEGVWGRGSRKKNHNCIGLQRTPFFS